MVEVDENQCGPDSPLRPGYEQDELIKLYVLADALDDLLLRNRALKGLVEINFQPLTHSTAWAYENTPATSKLRGILVKLATWRWNRQDFVKDKADHHPEFLRDLSCTLMLMTTNQIHPYPLTILSANLEDESNA